MQHKARGSCRTWRATMATKHSKVTNFKIISLTTWIKLTMETKSIYRLLTYSSQIHLLSWTRVKTKTDSSQCSSRKATSTRKTANCHLNLKLVEQTRLETRSISMTCSSRLILKKSLALWHPRKSSARMTNQSPKSALGNRTSPRNMTISQKVVNMMGVRSLIQEDLLKRSNWFQNWSSLMICHTCKYP